MASQNTWKYLSIGAVAVLAVGFSFPQAFAAPIDSVLTIVRDVQAKINDSNNGLAAIKNSISNTNTGLPAVNAQLAEIQTTLQQSALPGTPYSQTFEEYMLPSDHASGDLTVPEGKIWVIETITGRIETGDGDIPQLYISPTPSDKNTIVLTNAGETQITIQGSGVLPSGTAYTFHQPTRLYESDGDSRVQISLSRSGSASTHGYIHMVVTGYLVDGPQ